MTEYFILYVIIIVLSIIYMGRVEGKRKKRLCILVFGLITILLGFRHPSMGIDLGYDRYYGYLDSFIDIAGMGWKELIQLESYLNYEKGYILFNKLLALLGGDNVQTILIGCAVVSVLPVGYVVYKKSSNIFLSAIIYLGLPSFGLLFSGLRQSIAIGMCFYSILFIQEKKPLKFMITILIATLFHGTCIFFLVSYILYHFKCNTEVRMLSFISLPVIFVFRTTVFKILSVLVNSSVELDYNGSVALMLVFILIYFVCVLFSNKSKEQQGYMNIFYLACVCQIFANVFMTAARMGYYFTIVLVLLLPSVCTSVKGRKAKIIMTTGVSLCFILLGFYLIYTMDWAMAYPYYWFWETV